MKDYPDVSAEFKGDQPRSHPELLWSSYLLGAFAGCALLLTSQVLLPRISACIYLVTLFSTAVFLASEDYALEIRRTLGQDSRGIKALHKTLALFFHVMPVLFGICYVGELTQITAASDEAARHHIVARLMIWTNALEYACFFATLLMTAVAIVYAVASIYRRKRTVFDPTSRVWKQVDTVAVWPRR